MKIGQLVKHHIKKIFLHCETVDHKELSCLKETKYSKNTFGINFPFCTESSLIPDNQSGRYWTDLYLVRGETVRVSSQWYDKNEPYFYQYLLKNRISTEIELASINNSVSLNEKADGGTVRPPRGNSRYRGNAIGNAQNLFVRNILSNLGQESFNETDWEKTKAYFSNQCAYCGSGGDLLVDHIIPINRKSLGEHRLGNLVPSCEMCNSKKADKDFRNFLDGKSERRRKIEDYMESRNYVPLENNEQVAMIVDMAYREISSVAERYTSILNKLFPNS